MTFSPTAILIAILCALCAIQTYRLDSAQDAAKDMKMDLTLERLVHESKLRQKEKEASEALDAFASKTLQEKKDAEAALNSTIDGLRTDNLQLRKRFTCPKPAPASQASSGVDGEEAAGLSEEDAGFLLREAHRADLMTIERNELIDIVTMYRKALDELHAGKK